MAYVADQAETDPNAPAQPTGQPGNAPMNLPPAPATSSGAPGTTGSLSAPAASGGQGVSATPTAGRTPPVQNLQDYLTANQPQAVAMGQKIADNLTAGATKVTGDIGADISAIDQGVQATNVAPNPDLVNTAAANPSEFVKDPNNVSAFLKQRDASYTGPDTVESLPEWQSLVNEVNAATAGAPSTNLASPSDYLTLAAGQETNPTPGMTNLDAALLMETPGAAQPIIGAAAPYQALGGQMTKGAADENAKIATAKQNATAAKGLIAPAFTTGPNAVVPAWEKALQDKLTGAQTETTHFNTQAGKDVAMENMLQSLIGGFQNTSGMPIAYAPPTYQPITNAPEMASVASPEDYATESALTQLLGNGIAELPLNPSDASKAGTYTAPGSIMTESDIAKAYTDPIYNALMNAPINKQGAMPQNEVAALTSLSNYLNQFDPANFHSIPGTPSESWVYPSRNKEMI